MSEFAKKLDDWLTEYRMTEAALASELGMGQKSVNRYRRGETTPDEERQAKITAYFNKLAVRKEADQKVKNRTRTSQNSDDLEVSGEETQMPDKPYDQEYYLKMEYTRNIGREDLKVFTEVAQKYIASNYSQIGSITPLEFEFVEKLRNCDEKRRERIVSFLEHLPESMEMSMVDDDCIIPPSEDYYDKSVYTRHVLYEMSKYVSYFPKNWFKKNREFEDRQFAEPAKEILTKFTAEAMSFSQYMDCGTVIENAKILAGYKREDWYYLYLFVRTELYDEKSEIARDGAKTGWNQQTVWKMFARA